MKNREEIEQLADERYGEYAGYHKASFVNGYTQCQEDMADKKYTEEQMKACFYHNFIDEPKVMFQDYLKEYVLNKQE